MLLTYVMSLPRRLPVARRAKGSMVVRWLSTLNEIWTEVNDMRRAAGARYHFSED